MDRIEQAIQAEKAGDFRVAGKVYGLEGFEKFFDDNYEYGAGLRRGVTHILESMSADVRGGNRNRASVTFETTERFFRDCISEPEDPILVGFGWEWLADAELLIERPAAIDHYSNAMDQFDDLTLDEQLFWGAVPEYDNAYGAMDRYFDTLPHEYPQAHSKNFRSRAQVKAEVASSVLD